MSLKQLRFNLTGVFYQSSDEVIVLDVYKDHIEIQIGHSKNKIDTKEYIEKNWIIVAKKEAERYRIAILQKLFENGTAKVLAYGNAINKLWLILDSFLLKRKDTVRIKQIQIDVAVSDQGKPYSVMKVILQRRDQNA